MTIRDGRAGAKTPGSNKIDILADPQAKIIIENMTGRYARQLDDFKAGRLHRLPCICWLCLWRKFENGLPVGPPYDYKTFLAYDILSEITDVFQYEPVRKIAVRRLARVMIRRLPIISAETKEVLNDFAREMFETHFVEYAYRGRYRTDKLSSLVEELIHQIHRDWQRGRPEPVATINLMRQTPASLALKVARFVYSRPDRKATQRELQRHTNKPKADLEVLREWLAWRYGITVPPHEKWESTIYIGTFAKSLKWLLT